MDDDLTPAQKIDLDERIAIRLEDKNQDEEEAAKKARAELDVWWEDLAT